MSEQTLAHVLKLLEERDATIAALQARIVNTDTELDKLKEHNAALTKERDELKEILEKGCIQADHDGIYAICPVMHERDELRGKVEKATNELCWEKEGVADIVNDRRVLREKVEKALKATTIEYMVEILEGK